jgi:hypothetical protein
MEEISLGEKQRLFVKLIGMLILHAYDKGYEMTLGDAYRDPRLAALNAQQGKGIPNSLHSIRLAVDFNLFLNDVYMPRSESYTELGEYWKSLHPLCCWGGDFKTTPDGNRFSLTHGGVK